MNAGFRVAAGSTLALAALLALGALSRIEYVAEPASHGVVRLAWRTRGTRVQECRHRTAAEMAKLPAHMREGEVCEGRILPYLLTVGLDGTVDTVTIRASGARQDRPLYVYREFPVAAGSHQVRVEFTRQGTPREEAAHDERLEPPHPERNEATPAPARLALDTLITVEERDVLLVTYDTDSQHLVIRRTPGS